MTKHARSWKLTLNKVAMKHYEDIKDYLVEELKSNYFLSILGEDKKEELHIHIFVQFPRYARISGTKCYGADIESCRGTPEDNVKYLTELYRSSDIDLIMDEIGKLRTATKGRGVTAFDLMEIPLEEGESNPSETYKPDLEVWYFYGKTGSGKTCKVFDILVEELGNPEMDYAYYERGYWRGVSYFDQPEVCIYDDFHDSDMKIDKFLDFIDNQCHTLNLRCKYNAKNKYKKIYITSVQSPYEIYKNAPEEKRQELLRRIHHKIEMKTPSN